MTWSQIGAALGITAERARQIGVGAMRKLATDDLIELLVSAEQIRALRSPAQACIDEGDGTTGTAGGYRHGERHWSAQ